MESSPSGRALPIRGGDMLGPAVCLMCRRPGTNVDEVFVDLQNFEEWIGNSYLCRNCALECASVFGAYSKEEIDGAMNQRDQLLAEVAVSHARIQELEAALDTASMVRLRDRGFTALDGAILSDSYNLTTEPTLERLTTVNISGAGEGTESPEPSESVGPAEFNESASSDNNDYLRRII